MYHFRHTQPVNSIIIANNTPDYFQPCMYVYWLYTYTIIMDRERRVKKDRFGMVGKTKMHRTMTTLPVYGAICSKPWLNCYRNAHVSTVARRACPLFCSKHFKPATNFLGTFKRQCSFTHITVSFHQQLSIIRATTAESLVCREIVTTEHTQVFFYFVFIIE